MNEESALEVVAALDRLTAAVAILGFIVGIFLVAVYITAFVKGGKGMPAIPDPLKFDSKKANELYESGKTSQLIDYASTCITKYPNDIEARWYLGLAYFYARDFHSALEQFNEVIRINPGWKEDPVGPYLEEIEGQLSIPPVRGDRH